MPVIETPPDPRDRPPWVSPASVVTADAALSDAAFRLLTAILGASSRDGRCSASNAELGARVGGKHPTTISALLRELVDRGCVRVEYANAAKSRRTAIECLVPAARVEAAPALVGPVVSEITNQNGIRLGCVFATLLLLPSTC
jgi:hypothetical protein